MGDVGFQEYWVPLVPDLVERIKPGVTFFKAKERRLLSCDAVPFAEMVGIERFGLQKS